MSRLSRSVSHGPVFHGGSRSFASESFATSLRTQLGEIRDAGLYKDERIITSRQSAEIRTTETLANETVLNFCANNYLGFSDNEILIESARMGLESHGLGLSSVRFICGTQDIHKELERKIASFHKMDDCILYASCFDANAGIFEALLSKDDGVISDKLNHASIIDGIRLCKGHRYLYEHMDMKSLEDKLVQCNEKGVPNRLIVTDGCFSMDGDIAPLDKICALANQYNAMVLIDECHATGFMGASGRGTDEHFGVRVDIINSTLGKSLGGATGGYTAGPQEVIDMLRQRSRPYLFSNALAPSLVTAAIKVFEMIDKDTSYLTKLKDNTYRFRNKMTENGFKLMGDPSHPIAPVMIGDARLAQVFANDMLAEGIYVIGFSYPVVPQGLARIRVQISAGHSFQQIDRCVDAFIKIAIKHGLLDK